MIILCRRACPNLHRRQLCPAYKVKLSSDGSPAWPRLRAPGLWPQWPSWWRPPGPGRILTNERRVLRVLTNVWPGSRGCWTRAPPPPWPAGSPPRPWTRWRGQRRSPATETWASCTPWQSQCWRRNMKYYNRSKMTSPHWIILSRPALYSILILSIVDLTMTILWLLIG